MSVWYEGKNRKGLNKLLLQDCCGYKYLQKRRGIMFVYWMMFISADCDVHHDVNLPSTYQSLTQDAINKNISV